LPLDYYLIHTPSSSGSRAKISSTTNYIIDITSDTATSDKLILGRTPYCSQIYVPGILYVPSVILET